MGKSPAVSPFLFVAVRSTGGRQVGVRRARSVAELTGELRRERMMLLRSYRLPDWASPERSLSLKDRAEFNGQLSSLLSRGVPLVEALEVVEKSGKGAMPLRAGRIRQKVAAGSSLAEAARSEGGFDEVTIGVYAAAERTGDLAGATSELARAAKRQQAVAGKAITLLIYPAIVLTISFLVAVLMLTVIVPRLATALIDAGIQLPWFSKIVMNSGLWARDNVVVLGVGAAAALALLLVLRRAISGAIRGASRRLPLVKQVVLAQESARFFAVMAAMSRAGMPLADSLGVATRALGHPVLRSQLERLRERLIAGGVLRLLIDEVSALPLSTRRLLIAAERSGDLDAAFGSLAEDTAAEVDVRTERLLAALEPALIVLMFLIIGTLLMSILLPMLTLSGQVR